MSAGPNMFGRPMPTNFRQRSMAPPQNADAMYNAYPQQGMYVPQQGLFNNALMLGMRNPMQSLGYGAMPTYNRYAPPPPVQQQAAEPVPRPVQDVGQLETFLGYHGGA